MGFYVHQLIDLWGEPTCPENLSLEQEIVNICTDTRLIQKGSLFIPLRGKNFNGHAFLSQAKELGAQAALVSSQCRYQIPRKLSCWIVDDTLEAYQKLGLLHRSQLDIPVVAVTGSAGKTTTREFIRALLKPLGHVVASSENNNNDVGVPLTLLKARSSHGAVVVEMGMRGLGEIERLSRCARPDIGVITNIGSAHIGLLGGYEQIAKAKSEIAAYLNPNGVLVIPAGITLLEEALKERWNGRVIRVKLSTDILIEVPRAKELEQNQLPEADFSALFNTKENRLDFLDVSYQLPLEGRYNAFNFLLAIVVARELKVCPKSLKFSEVDLPSGRSKRIQIGNITVLDQTYNSSPEAVIEAMELLVSQPGRHFAVLGSMLELGEYSESLHRRVAEKAVSLSLDGLIVVASGVEAEVMEIAAGGLARFAVVNTPEKAINPLKAWLKPGDVLLLKASRAVALEKLLPILPRC